MRMGMRMVGGMTSTASAATTKVAILSRILLDCVDGYGTMNKSGKGVHRFS